MEEDNKIAFSAAQTGRLLSNDSTKTWNLVRKEVDDQISELEPCELENALVFGKAAGSALNTLSFDDSCDQMVIYDGFWEVLNQLELPISDTLIYLFNPDTLFKSEDSVFVDYDTLVNIIDQITSRNLTISRADTLNGASVFIKESYTSVIE